MSNIDEILNSLDSLSANDKQLILQKLNKEDLLKSIKEIFKGSEVFNIPEYQRGYKWTDKNVKVLLEDIFRFYNSNPDDSEFYCLQNITLVQKDDKYNVVDGQQRLTTVYIILNYLKYSGCEQLSDIDLKGKLIYSITHEGGDESSNKIISDKVFDRDFWELEIFNPEKINHKDEFYIRQVCNTVKIWFENKFGADKTDLRNEYIETLLNKVKFIENKVNGNEEIIFANLNGGKVQLDGADLIRAIIITLAAKEKFSDSDNERINEFRVRLGMELDSINRWWENKEVNSFFKTLLPNSFISNSASFNFNTYPINYLYAIYYKIQNLDSNNLTLDFFEKGINHDEDSKNDHLEMYNEIVKLHYELKDWYEDNEIYLFLGYLFKNYKNKSFSLIKNDETDNKKDNGNIINFINIYNMWNKSANKFEFKVELKKLIKILISAPLLKPNNNIEDAFNNELLAKIRNYKVNWYEDDSLIPILSLLDVIMALDKHKRIPLRYLSCYKEDKEHILPQAKKDVLGTDEHLLNSIGNLVLLDQSINRRYQDDYFDDKFIYIIKEYFNKNYYVRPFTFRVFLKKIETVISDSKNITDSTDKSNNIQIWGKDNIIKNAQFIATLLSDFFNKGSE